MKWLELCLGSQTATFRKYSDRTPKCSPSLTLFIADSPDQVIVLTLFIEYYKIPVPGVYSQTYIYEFCCLYFF